MIGAAKIGKSSSAQIHAPGEIGLNPWRNGVFGIAAPGRISAAHPISNSHAHNGRQEILEAERPENLPSIAITRASPPRRLAPGGPEPAPAQHPGEMIWLHVEDVV